MSQKHALISVSNHSAGSLEVAAKVAHVVDTRFHKWLISLRHSVDNSHTDEFFGRENKVYEEVIFEETDRVSDFQRLLLTVEKESIIRKQSEEETRQLNIQEAGAEVENQTKRFLKTLFQGPNDKLLRLDDSVAAVARVFFDKSFNFHKVYKILDAHPLVTKQLIDFAQNQQFCEQLGEKAKKASSIENAINLIGIEGCKVLIPLLIIKSFLRWPARHLKPLTPKLWHFMITAANATRLRLMQADYAIPAEGMYLGLMANIGYIAINNHFSKGYEEGLMAAREHFYENKNTELFYVCPDVMPQIGFLPDFSQDWSKQITSRLIDECNWGGKSYLHDALCEELNQIPLTKRSIHGAALGQGIAYAKFLMLKQSGIFLDNHLQGLFINAGMNRDNILTMNKLRPNLINLHSIVEQNSRYN